MQTWSSIPGFSDYLVSDHGEIKSIERTKTFKNGRKMKFESKKKQLNVSCVRLPRAKKKITLIKSPHVHKSSREQFETVSYKRLLLIEGEKKTIEEVINKDITKNRYSFFSQIKWSFKQSY